MDPTSPETCMSKLETTLAARAKTHGPFDQHSRVSQGLKSEYRRHIGEYGARFDDDMYEAIDMVMHKLARAIVGDPQFKDHWEDMAGYAMRVAERIDRDNSLPLGPLP